MISIIIPLYNKEAIVAKCIQSVLDQTYTDFELIVVDDGSTDKSLEIVKEFDDRRIVYHSKTNGGVSDARNCGIRLAKYENIFFLDADDLLSPNCLLHFANLMSKYQQISFFAANFELISQDFTKIYCSGKEEKEIRNPQQNIWHENILPRTGAMLINKQCFEKVGVFNTQISKFEDLDLILRILRHFSIVYSPEIVLKYQVAYAEQSKKIMPIEQEFAFYLNFKGASFYERLLLAWNLYNVLRERKKMGDNATRIHLMRKYDKYLYYIYIAAGLWWYRHYKGKIINLFTK